MINFFSERSEVSASQAENWPLPPPTPCAPGRSGLVGWGAPASAPDLGGSVDHLLPGQVAGFPLVPDHCASECEVTANEIM